MSKTKKYVITVLSIILIVGSLVGVYAIDPNDIITTVAGNGVSGFSGDGGQATAAQLDALGLAIDQENNIYIADFGNHRIRKVIAGTGVITTVVGIGTDGFSGDGGSALNAELNGPASVALDDAGNLYIADYSNQRIRRVISSTGVITTIVGIGTSGYSGDGGLAVTAELATPYSIALDKGGNLYIADGTNHCVRKVLATTGIITTVAGTGVGGFSGDGGSATAAQLNLPVGIALDQEDNLYIAEGFNDRIRKVFAATGIITTVVGTGNRGFSGDGGIAIAAELNQPSSIVIDTANNLYIADEGNHRIRKVIAGTGIITTVAGTGTDGFSGDGGAAIVAELKNPTGLALDRAEALYITDLGNYRIRKIEDPKIFLPIILKK